MSRAIWSNNVTQFAQCFLSSSYSRYDKEKVIFNFSACFFGFVMWARAYDDVVCSQSWLDSRKSFLCLHSWSIQSDVYSRWTASDHHLHDRVIKKSRLAMILILHLFFSHFTLKLLFEIISQISMYSIPHNDLWFNSSNNLCFFLLNNNKFMFRFSPRRIMCRGSVDCVTHP